MKTRLIVYPKDVQRITGKSERYGRLLIKQIKVSLHKSDHQFVTIDEFCAFTGLPPEEVTTYINT